MLCFSDFNVDVVSLNYFFYIGIVYFDISIISSLLPIIYWRCVLDNGVDYVIGIIHLH